MTNPEMAERLEQIASDLDGMDSGNADSPILRAGAEALLVMDQRKREECAHCDERPGGHEGTIWCAECLNWWRQQHSTQEADAAQREVERLRASLDHIGIGGNHLASALIHLLGAGDDTFPPYKTDFDAAGKIINDPIKMDLWTCWAVMMRERDAIEAGAPTPDHRDARITELEADKARWDALEALPYQIEVTMRMERVKHPAMISLREQVDGALKRIAALREAK